MVVFVNGELTTVSELTADSDTLLTFTRGAVDGTSADNFRCQISSTAFSAGANREAFHVLVRARLVGCVATARLRIARLLCSVR